MRASTAGGPVDVRAHRIEDQVPQGAQDCQGRHGDDADHESGSERGDEHRRCAAPPSLDHPRQTADVGTMEHRHQAPRAAHQECDDCRGGGGRDDHTYPVPVCQ